MVRLFCLDYLSMIEVLDNMDHIELFNLSLLSKKAARIVQNAIKQRKCEDALKVSIDRCPRVIIKEKQKADKKRKEETEDNGNNGSTAWKLICQRRARKRNQVVSTKPSQFNGDFFDISFENETLIYHWKDVKAGFVLMIDHLLDLHKPTIENCTLFDNMDTWVETMNVFEDKKLKVGSSIINMKEASAYKKACSILDKLPSIEKVDLNFMYPSEKFILSDQRMYCHTELNILSGGRVKIQHLYKMDCETLRVYGCNLTDDDLGSFFNYFIQGGMRKLKKLKLNALHWKIEQIFKSVPHRINDSSELRTRIKSRHIIGSIYQIERRGIAIGYVYKEIYLTEAYRVKYPCNIQMQVFV